MIISCFICVLCIVMLMESDAQAASALSHVGGASVTKGAISAEIRSGYTHGKEGAPGDGRLRIRQHLDVGFSDHYALRIVTVQDKREGENIEHQAVTFDHRFQFKKRQQHGWDAGIRLAYTHRDHDKTPHEGEIRFITQFPFSNGWSLRHNLFFEHELGNNRQSGISTDFRTELTKKLAISSPRIASAKAGLSMFNDIGTLSDISDVRHQSHQIGPMMNVRFNNGVYIQTGYRAAVSNGRADHFVTFALGKFF